MKKIASILISFILSLPQVLALTSSVNKEYYFKYFDTNSGLSQNTVNCIFQDTKGYLWVGTLSGINRFNGSEFRQFRADNQDSLSISNNYITDITADKNGNVWIATEMGINRFDSRSETFAQYRYGNDPSNAKYCLPSDYIKKLTLASDSTLWMLSGNNLLFYNEQLKRWQEIDSAQSRELAKHGNISFMQADNQNNLWLTYDNYETLTAFDIKNNKLTHYRMPELSGSARSSFLRSFIDSEGEIWIASNLNNLHIFNPSTKKFRKFDLNISLPDVNIVAFSEDQSGKIWITSAGTGIIILNKKRGVAEHLYSSEPILGSMFSSSVYAVLHDKNGGVWIGSEMEGVAYSHPIMNRFHLHKEELGSNDNLLNCIVNDVIVDQNQTIWVATENGVKFKRSDSDKFIDFPLLPKSNRLTGTYPVVCLLETHDGKIWFGTYQGGLFWYDPKSGAQSNFQIGTSANTISGDKIYALSEDADRNLWIGTLGNGVDRLNLNNQQITKFTNANGELSSDYITSIALDPNNQIWIGASYGITVLTPRGELVKKYIHDSKDPNSLRDNHITTIFRDKQNRMWVGTRLGLDLFDNKNDQFVHFDLEERTVSNSIFAILDDDNGDLWISTSNGITQVSFINANQGLDGFKTRAFNSSDGLQGKEFRGNAAFKTADGMMLFGGSRGLNSFYPNQIKADTSAPKVVITHLRVFNQEILPYQKYKNRTILKQAIDQVPVIELNYSENFFTLEFAALEFIKPENCKYAYLLEGFNQEWIYTTADKREATFTNLNPGEYRFMVKVANGDGIWGEEVTSVKIIINPPFWLTKTAIFIMVLCLFGLLYLLRQMILSRARKNMQMENERFEIKQQHELDQLKLNFFTNVSHEFKTPLTLILSPVEQLIKELEQPRHLELLQIIHQNAKRLLNLVSQLLDLRRVETQGLKYYPSVGNIALLIKNQVLSFKDYALKNGIQLTFKSNNQEFNATFDSDKVEKIVNNLLSNAFKFTATGGTVKVELNIIEQSEIDSSSSNNLKESYTLQLTVSDTGCGIDEKDIERIFDRFVQLDNKNASGYGIGLSMVKEYVELHRGKIEVISKPNHGSTFIINIPIQPATEHVNDLELSEIHANPAQVIRTENLNHGPLLLIVEDNADMRNYIKLCLSEKYRIAEATNGSEALEYISNELPDLIISDIMMPGIDGISLCKAIKDNPETSHIPIILLTAKSSEEQKKAGFEAGADDYITKPFNMELLELRINSLTERRNKLREHFNPRFDINPKNIEIVSVDEKLIARSIEIVEANISNPDFSVEQLSKEIGMSRVNLYKKLLALTGNSPADFIRILRLKRATQLLRKSQLSVAEIAYEVGFNNPRYFSKHFKDEYGMLPSKYAKENNEKAS